MTDPRRPIFTFLAPYLKPPGWSNRELLEGMDRHLDLLSVPRAGNLSGNLQGNLAGSPQIGLSAADFRWAASQLGCTVAQIRAVDEVESGGGWFTDVRASILGLDGPGGFIDGPHLPKILFEAHIFARHTTPRNRFNATHPNLSSAKWNRSLYVGGQAEWERLYRAMLLDAKAALMSASVGRYQIMGFNHKLAGFDDVELFWAAMKESERRHLEAFVAFIKASKLTAALGKISNVHADCLPFAVGYNGAGQGQHNPPYNIRIARAHKKWAAA